MDKTYTCVTMRVKIDITIDISGKILFQLLNERTLWLCLHISTYTYVQIYVFSYQALDAAQRILDQDSTNIDAIQIIAVHAFTQECQPHDTLQKLEDLDNSLGTLEPNSVRGPLEVAALFCCICSRQQRALQICFRLLERAFKHCRNVQEEAEVLTLMGKIHLMQVSTLVRALHVRKYDLNFSLYMDCIVIILIIIMILIIIIIIINIIIIIIIIIVIITTHPTGPFWVS